ncbi:hypothetical protein D3C81_1840020 [compost metagenome]
MVHDRAELDVRALQKPLDAVQAVSLVVIDAVVVQVERLRLGVVRGKRHVLAITVGGCVERLYALVTFTTPIEHQHAGIGDRSTRRLHRRSALHDCTLEGDNELMLLGEIQLVL